MLVLSVNKIAKWCQLISNGRTYTRPTKEINGVLCFSFKKAWHPVSNFLCDNAHELVRIGEETILRKFSK